MTMPRLWWKGLYTLVAVAALTGCKDQKTDTCTTDDDCPGTQECSANGLCTEPNDPNGEDPVCGDGIWDQSAETCDTAIPAGQAGACPTSCAPINACVQQVLKGEGCEAYCERQPAIKTEIDGDGCCPEGATASSDSDCVDPCGNGIVDEGEACDDGEENGLPNKCNATCTNITDSWCGNGVVEAGEACDDQGESEDCNADCTIAVCGDGVMNAAAGEACDTGEESATCNADCTLPVCGDGIVNHAAGETCDDGDDNGKPNKCNAQCTGTADAVCGNGIIEAGETCDDGDDNGTPQHCNSSCTGETAAICGNGVVETGEACDDGGESALCNSDCTAAACGDGVVNTTAGEECDDGDDNDDAGACFSDCTANTCGDGILNPGVETCDAGTNNGQPNECNTTCTGITAAVCGNGIIEAGEDCDTSGESATCNADCSAVLCGDGILNASAGEECDDGDDNADEAACTLSCTIATCGDGYIEAGVEVCDDGPSNGQPNSCNATCTGPTSATCGNNTVEAGEDCDDGPAGSATCTTTCTISACGDGIRNTLAGEQCDLGANNSDTGACTLTCQNARCGDGLIRAGTETCDDGPDNGKPNKCNATCTGTTAAVCGNNIIEAGEDCDDGASGSATCTTTCKTSTCGDGIVNAAAGETCDNGPDNGQPNKCNATCDGMTPSVCGNNVTEAGEDCDAGPNGSATCTTTCKTSVCGDSIINTLAGETCDDGIDNGKPNKCNATCNGTTAAVCGNNVVEAGEDCDEGGVDHATCNADCTTAVCGDGYHNPAAGEECDEAGATATCDAQCQEVGAAPTAYRVTDAKIIDPRFYQSVFICLNITGQVNDALSDALTKESSGDPTTYGLNMAIVIDDLQQVNNRVHNTDIQFPHCLMTAPWTCTQDLTSPLINTSTTVQTTGSCVPASMPGRTSGYDAHNTAPAPCFRTSKTNISLNLGGIEIDLEDAQVFGSFVGNLVKNGLIVGFLPKSVADAVLLPSDLPVVGGKKLSALLRGGGGCGTPSDLDTHLGVQGWWFYLNVNEAKLVPWAE